MTCGRDVRPGGQRDLAGELVRGNWTLPHPVLRTTFSPGEKGRKPFRSRVSLPQCHAAGLGPDKPLDGAATGLVFAADVAGVAAGVDLLQQPGVVEIAGIWLAAIG